MDVKATAPRDYERCTILYHINTTCKYHTLVHAECTSKAAPLPTSSITRI